MKAARFSRFGGPEVLEIVDLADPHPGPGQNLTDFAGASEHGVRFSRGDSGRALHAVASVGELVEAGRFALPVGQTFPLAEIAEAHRVGESGRVHGRLILLVG